jgi:DinB family protein
MKKSDINPMPQYYDRYINLAPDAELSRAFDDSIAQLDGLNRNLLDRLDGKTYESGKWTVNDIIQHVTDVERILAYRALLFARGNGTSEGFDQNAFAANARADDRATDNLIDELITVRRATRSLYDGFDDQALQAKVISWEYEISVLALGFTIIGHQTHHLNVIQERYHPLLAETSSASQLL